MSNNCMATDEVYVNAEHGYEVSAELVCQRGTVTTEHVDKALVRGKANRGYFVASDWINPFQDAYVAELINWVDSLQGKESSHGAAAWDGYVPMMVTAACIQSLNTAAIVLMKLIEKKTALYK